MKKSFLLIFLFCAYMLNAQTYEDVTPSSFVQGLDNNCSSATGDINGDGKLDIILTGKASSVSQTWVYLNDGNGGFTLSTTSGLDIGLFYSWIDLGDYDGDGDLDIVMQGWQTISGTDYQKAYVFQNDGNGVFTQVAELQGRSNGTIQWGDYNNDGKLDILQIGWNSTTSGALTTIYKNEGNNTFTPITQSVTPVADGQARWGDYNNDGNLDIIIAGWGMTKIYQGDGTGNFTQTSFSLTTNYNNTWVDWIDYNNDGILDIILAGLNSGSYYTMLYKGLSDYTYVDASAGLQGVQKGPICYGDCNNDGYMDFFISGWNGAGYFGIYKNDGSNTSFSSVSGLNSVIAGWADGTMQVADYDEDGYDEIFKCGWTLTKLYKNTARGTVTNIQNVNKSQNFTITQKGTILNIQVLNNSNNKNAVEVFSLTGKKVFSDVYTTNDINIDLENQVNGVYIIKVNNKDSSSSKKIILK